MLSRNERPTVASKMRMDRELAGTIAGFVATAPMTVAMMALHKALPPEDQDPLPPRQIVENAAATGASTWDQMKRRTKP